MVGWSVGVAPLIKAGIVITYLFSMVGFPHLVFYVSCNRNSVQRPLQGKAGSCHLSTSQLPFSEKEHTRPQLAAGEANDGPHL